MSWKPELKVEGQWYDNQLRFATKQEAEEAAKETYSNWMLARDYRASESDEPVNYKRIDGKNVHVEDAR